MMSSQRKINEYDVLRAFAIILVVIGHITILFKPTSHPQDDTRIAQAITFGIYIFHMPLFMAISGAIYQLSKSKVIYSKFLPFLINKFKRIIIPYFCVGIFALLPVLVFITPHQTWSDPETWLKILWAKDCRHLWYLLALFWIFILQFTADRLHINLWFLLVFSSILTLARSWVLPQHQILCLNMALRYWPIFILGMIMVRYLNDLSMCKALNISVIGGGVCVLVIAKSSNFYIDTSSALILPYFICLALIVVARQLSLSSKWEAIVREIAGYSFGIYLFHVMVIFLMRHWLDSLLNMWVLMGLMFIVSISASVGITALLRKLNLGFVIGEKRRR